MAKTLLTCDISLSVCQIPFVDILVELHIYED